MYYEIYISTNKLNNHAYIGQHRRPGMENGITDSYFGSGYQIVKALKKYGKENFTKYVIAFCHTQIEADILEIFFISYYKNEKKYLYNISDGGQGGNMGEAVSAILSRKNKERWNKSSGYKEWWKNRVSNSENYRMSLTSKNRSKKISDAQKKRFENLEARKKVSDTQKKVYENPEARKRMSIIQKKVYENLEIRKKISNGLKNSKKYQDSLKNPESRKHKSDAQKKRWTVEERMKASYRNYHNNKFKKAMADTNTRKKRAESIKNSEKNKVVRSSIEYREKMKEAQKKSCESRLRHNLEKLQEKNNEK